MEIVFLQQDRGMPGDTDGIRPNRVWQAAGDYGAVG
jgi:hypothetical protein